MKSTKIGMHVGKYFDDDGLHILVFYDDGSLFEHRVIPKPTLEQIKQALGISPK